MENIRTKERIVIDCEVETKSKFNSLKSDLLRQGIKNNEETLLWLINKAGVNIKFR